RYGSRSTSAGVQPMPAFCVRPNRSPEGHSRSIASVNGKAPEGPSADVCTSRMERSRGSMRSDSIVAGWLFGAVGLGRFSGVRDRFAPPIGGKAHHTTGPAVDRKAEEMLALARGNGLLMPARLRENSRDMPGRVSPAASG